MTNVYNTYNETVWFYATCNLAKGSTNSKVILNAMTFTLIPDKYIYIYIYIYILPKDMGAWIVKWHIAVQF